MGTSPQIRPTNMKVWTNRHETFRAPINNMFDVSNGDTGDAVNDYNATTAAIGQFIGEARKKNKAVRALGGGWSFTKVATVAGGWMLNTKHLNLVFTVGANSVSPLYTGQPDQLLFAQCGNSVQELNNYLKGRNRSLKTSGASNGQTIVGAFSTGTHGSAIDFGSTPDFVAGLHIIRGPNDHVWLERASYPVVSDSFLEKIQATIIRDDELFNAALVSFGSFGFIHGVLLETEELFLLECYRRRVPFDAGLQHVMSTLDFSQAQFLPHGPERPFHFQVVVNPYDIADGLYVTAMYKRPYTPDYTPWVRDFTKAGPGDDAPAFLGGIAAKVPVLTHGVVNQLVKSVYAPFENFWGTMGEVFYNTDARGKICSTSFAVPLEHVLQVQELMMELNATEGPFAGVFAYRYVKKCEATLAFACYAPSCLVEIDGAETAVARRFYEAVWRELINRGIPHAYHWGKMHHLDTATVKNLFGEKRDRWIAQRNKLLDAASIRTFNNEALAEMGLDEVLQPLLPV